MQTEATRDPLLSPEQAATRLNVQPKTLEVWRSTKRYAIGFVKVGRLVRYRASEIERIASEGTGPAFPYTPQTRRGPRKAKPAP